ncbi:MAG TPA: polyprenol phosphomannose-dependent alpha 1,6 mannosyltransferase MptB [Acidimicrobiales bacterium]|nr:polyprenol phosphomannose-dependent alpha 1,6 mannosyltransferase MptB [Acidimicrobiales bacterium]
MPPLVPDTAELDAQVQPAPQISLARTAILGALGTTAVVAGALLGGPSFEAHLPGAWFFGMPGGTLGWLGTSETLPPVAALALVFGGLILLTRVWLGFLRYLKNNEGFPVKRVVLVVVVWAVPLLLAPPLFSRDVYTYAAQGEMVSHNINPYVYGPNVLGSTPFNTFSDPFWANNASPYGPNFLTVDGAVDQASGHNFLIDLLLLRLVEIAGIALMVAATPTLARWAKRDPAHAVLLGAGSPLVLLSLLAGDHNDALMVGLLMAGLAVARRFGTVPGVVICALAAGVKSPAALGVLFLGWVWAGPDASVRRRIGHTALAGLIALATMELATLVSGFGWGWVGTSTTAAAAFTGVTPINVVARVVSMLTHLLQVPVSTAHLHPVFEVLGLLVAAYVAYRLLRRAPQDGVVRALGLALLVVALLSPIVWAWYVTWGVVVAAAAASPRMRNVLIVVATFWAFAGVTSVHNIYMRMLHTFVLSDLLLVTLLLAVAIMPLGQFALARPDRQRLPRVGTRLTGAGAAAS